MAGGATLTHATPSAPTPSNVTPIAATPLSVQKLAPVLAVTDTTHAALAETAPEVARTAARGDDDLMSQR